MRQRISCLKEPLKFATQLLEVKKGVCACEATKKGTITRDVEYRLSFKTE